MTQTTPRHGYQERAAQQRAAARAKLPARTLDWGGSLNQVLIAMLIVFAFFGLLGVGLSLL